MQIIVRKNRSVLFFKEEIRLGKTEIIVRCSGRKFTMKILFDGGTFYKSMKLIFPFNIFYWKLYQKPKTVNNFKDVDK